MRSKVWSANNHCRQAVQAPHGLVSWVAEVSNVAGPRELSSPMWQAHGGRNRFAVRLGLADQTRCPTTQGRWGRNARCACVRILLPRPLTRLLRDRTHSNDANLARSAAFTSGHSSANAPIATHYILFIVVAELGPTRILSEVHKPY